MSSDLDKSIMALLEKKKAYGQAWSRRFDAAVAAAASESSDPIMTVREYLTMREPIAEIFLNEWVKRQTNASMASAQAQGLRLKAMLAVADGSE